MKIVSRVLTLALAAASALAVLVPTDAEARRLGGGASFGRQSSNVTQRSVAPTPAQQPGTANAASATPPKPAGSRWMAPLAGLAAGLGLAALFSHLGLSEEFGSFLMLALFAMAAIFVIRMFLARRTEPSPAYAGSGYSRSALGGEAAVPRYEGVAGDARTGFPAAAGAAAAVAPTTWHIPDDFDVAGFVRNAKVQFVRLQAAFDAADLADLREFTTPEMFAELSVQVSDRKGAANRTDVVTLEGELLGIETTATEYIASIRFHGLIREDDASSAQDFDEVWNLTKPLAGEGGWVLAGLQQLS